MQNKKMWKNWSGNQQHIFEHWLQPDSLTQLCLQVAATKKCRVVGAGHSFSALVNCGDTMVSLDNLSGLLSYDAGKHQAQLLAGTRLFAVNELLAQHGQALLNQGDIDRQSLAGAIATGTHGTGFTLPCIADNVVNFQLVTAQGELLNCSPQENAEVFNLGRVNLGALGVFYAVTLQNRQSYQLCEHIYLENTEQLLSRMDALKEQHRHIELLPFIYAEKAIVKTLDISDAARAPKQQPAVSDDMLLYIFSELARWLPVLNPWVQKMLGSVVSASCHVDASYKIFPTPRNTRFNEMEYQVPAQCGAACLQEILATLKKHKAPIFFPLEYRYVKADNIALSPFYQRDSVSISVHQYHKEDFRKIFTLIEPIFLRYQGRPHWGKWHSLTARELAPLYERWDDFLQLRKHMDPGNKFINPHLQTILGVMP